MHAVNINSKHWFNVNNGFLNTYGDNIEKLTNAKGRNT